MKRIEITFTFDDDTRSTSIFYDSAARPGVALDDDAIRSCLAENPTYFYGSSFEEAERRFRARNDT
jgi:hypothetical protein